jgi:hypothetical protein
MSYKAYSEFGFSPSQTITSAVINTLEGYSIHEGDSQKVDMRCARIKDGYLIDLTNADWSAVRVTPSGWEIVKSTEIKFIRSSTVTALPDPVEGELSLLWKHVNIPKEYHPLIVAYMIETWRSDTPYPILELSGEQGSAKSTTHKRLRQITDPNKTPLRTAPKDVQDVFVSAANNHQASFENMSNLSGNMQDALCTLSTGGGYASRRLYTNSEEEVIEVKRPVIINGICSVASQSDLIDRLIHVDLPRIQGHKLSAKMDEEFDKDLPHILGGLLTIFSNTLGLLPDTQINDLPRMADFVLLGEAMMKAMNNDSSFKELFLKNRTDSLCRSLEASPVTVALFQFVKEKGMYAGTVKSLKDSLDLRFRDQSEGWPKSPKGLSDVLRRTSPALREMGIDVEFLGHKRDGTHIEINRLENFDNTLTN